MLITLTRKDLFAPILGPVVDWIENIWIIRVSSHFLMWLGIPEVWAIHLLAPFWGLLCVLAYYGWKIGLSMMRLRLPKAADATAEWATWSDLRKHVLMPSNVLIAVWCIIGTVITFMFIGWQFDLPIAEDLDLLIISSLSGLIIGGLTAWGVKEWRQNALPYVLGRPKGPLGLGRRAALYGGVAMLHGLQLFPGKHGRNKRQEHVLICGPTGTGKTTRFFVPQLIRDAQGNCSAFVIETKTTSQESSFLQLVGPAWSYFDKPVTLVDPWSGGPTAGWNPLAELKADPDDPMTIAGIEQIVDAIVKTAIEESGRPGADATFHLNNEVRLLKTLCMVALFKPKEQRNLPTIRQAVASTWDDMRLWLTTDIPNEPMLNQYINMNAQWIIRTTLNKDHQAGILTGLMSKLKICEDPGCARVLASDELRIGDWLERPGLLIIRSPMDRPSGKTFASIFTRILSLRIYRRPKFYANAPFALWLYLDELPTLSLPQFPTLAATIRDSGSGIIAATQDLEDLFTMSTVKAGANSADSLLGNFRTQIVLHGCSPYTCQWYSKAMGMTSSEHRRVGRESNVFIHMRYYREHKAVPLITPDDLRHIKEDEAMVFRSQTRPFMVKTWRYWEDRATRFMIWLTKDTPIQFRWTTLNTTPRSSQAPVPWATLPRAPAQGLPQPDSGSLVVEDQLLQVYAQGETQPSAQSPQSDEQSRHPTWGMEGEW